MMRLAYFVNTPQFFLSHWEPLALAARKAGYDVHVICPDGDAVGTIHSREWPVHVVSLDRTFGAPLKEVRSIGQVSRLYGSLKPDVVHHLSLKPITYGGIAARIARVPAVAATVTGLGYAFSHSGARARCARSAVITLSRVALRHPNQLVFFENEDDQSLFDKLTISRTGESALVPGAGVDCTSFTPKDEPLGPPLVILPGRMLWDKGVDVLVKASRILLSRNIRARFALVGECDPGNPACVPEPWLKTEASPVEFWGHRSDMSTVFAQASVVCLPSHREGLPKALAEAAACGRPVVTTDVPGCRDAIENGVTGLLVPKNDALATADALERLLLSPGLRAKMGRRGRQLALRKFDIARITETVLKSYSRLLHCPPSQPCAVLHRETARQSLSARVS